MVNIVGHRIRHEHLGKTAICQSCADAISFDTGNAEKVRSDQIASSLCVICEYDMTNGNGGSIDYPTEICILLEEHFKDKGSRFGGVHTRIENESEKEEIRKGVSVSKPIPSAYDPVLVMLQENEQNIVSDLKEFISIIETKGRIRGKIETYNETEDDMETTYEFIFFAVQ